MDDWRPGVVGGVATLTREASKKEDAGPRRERLGWVLASVGIASCTDMKGQWRERLTPSSESLSGVSETEKVERR
jgi:hypothetical protein